MFRAIVLIVFTLYPGCAQTSMCPLFTKLPLQSEGERLMEYLREATGHTTACDVEALLRIESLSVGGRGDKSWIQVLVGYLGLKQPQPVVAGGGYRPYPAASALVVIGEPAIPALLKVVGSGGSNSVERANAIDAVTVIRSGEKGVRTLWEAGRTADDPTAAARLVEAAREASKHCQGTDRPKCEAILTQ